MKEVFYINSERYNVASFAYALKKAIDIADSDGSVQSIVVLVPTANQFSLLTEIFPEKAVKNRSYYLDELDCSIMFETVKTYNTNMSEHHVLIPLCLSEKDMLNLEDIWSAYYWIVVPNTFEELESWLKIHSAIDVESNEIIKSNYSVDEHIVNAIGWLKATSFPNEGFVHPLDLNRLKSMANAVAHMKYTVDYDAILNYCINNGINHDGGRKIADHFLKAQSRTFRTDGDYSVSFLKTMMNEKH